ncbi:MAG: PAS domain S-box protein [Vicinamibacterales bacterium]
MSDWTSLDRLAALVEFSTDAVVVVDGQGIMRWLSPSIAVVLGYDPATLVGVRARDLIEHEDIAAWEAFVGDLLDRPGVPLSVTVRCRHRDGTPRAIEAVARNLLAEPRVGGVVVHCRDVTSRIQTEAALADTEDRFSQLVNDATDVILETDEEGYFRFINPVALRVFGYTRDEVVGRRFTEFIHPDYRQDVFNHFLRQIDSRTPMSYVEFPAVTRDGREVWLGQNTTLMLAGDGSYRGLRAVSRDITERKRTENALRQAEAKYRALVEQSLTGVFILQENRFVYVNPKGAAMLGYTQDELLALPSAFDVIAEADRPFVIDQVSRLATGVASEVQVVIRGRRKDGTTLQGEVFGTVSVFEGAPAVLATGLDISDRVRLEEQLRQAQKMEAVGRLAGGIAHDFNNLLTAIRGNAELLSHRFRGDAVVAADIDEILHAADRAASLTRQLLAFSRKQDFMPVALDVNEMVESVARMVRRIIGADVRLEIDTRPVRRVLADPAHVEQVLLNLVVNARDALPTGGMIRMTTGDVSLAAGAPELAESGLEPGDYVRVQVADNGVGMDQATQMRIFEPFFTTKEPGRGTGLGLATVYGIVRQTGGAVSVVSERGGGSTFTVLLPAATADALERAAGASGHTKRSTEEA